jgi:polyhydroxyalkanoate synthesis regulator phasin
VPNEASARDVEPDFGEPTKTLTERVSALEQQVRDLRAELAAVRVSVSLD